MFLSTISWFSSIATFLRGTFNFFTYFDNISISTFTRSPFFKLDKPNDKSADKEVDDSNSENKYRKVSASPTVFKGTVYYPVYTPPEGDAKCGAGNAYICSADDECGINNSEKIQYASKSVRSDSQYDFESGCYYLQPGIVSRLVVFKETLFANVTTSSDDQEDTLISILSGASEVYSQKGSWRENY